MVPLTAKKSTLDYLSSLSAQEREEMLNFLTPAEKEEFNRLLILRDRRPWKPNAGPQTLAYYSKANKLYYGGSAGGGKTDLLVGLAGTRHYKSIIFRREFPQLKDVVQRIEEVFGDKAKTWKQSTTYRIRDGSDYRVLELGAAKHDRDLGKYRGRPHGLKAFDEGPEFPEHHFRFLTGWARSVDPLEHVRVVMGGNPPATIEGQWVIRFWGPWLDQKHSNPALPGELRWFAVLAGEDVEVEGPKPFIFKKELIYPESRTFIPASLDDNPAFRDPAYRATLQALPEPLRSQLLYGDFKVGLSDDEWQVIPSAWVDIAQKRWKHTPRPELPLTALGLDPSRGGKDTTAIAPRYGLWFDELQVIPGSDVPNGPAVAQHVYKFLEGAIGDPYINIDVIGIGSSVFDTLVGFNYEAYAVNVASGSNFLDRSRKLTCVNKRAEAYWRLREALDPQFGLPICLPPSPKLKEELCAARWRLTVRGILIEEKDDIKRRIGRSPDQGDAVVLGYMPPQAAVVIATSSEPPFSQGLASSILDDLGA